MLGHGANLLTAASHRVHNGTDQIPLSPGSRPRMGRDAAIRVLDLGNLAILRSGFLCQKIGSR